MKLSLSTNWCNRRIDSGEEIADLALSLGFEELELGYHTTPQQAKGFKARLDAIPVGSVHAFCPVPISAPQGYPELYSLASFDEEDRKMAQIQVKRTAAFAAEMGAKTVVLHAGRVLCDTWFKRNRPKKRRREGLKMVEVFKGELTALVPELERLGVTLALENLPYFEGFPDEAETAAILEQFKGAPVKAWFDTGHHRVRMCNGWIGEKEEGKSKSEIVRTDRPSGKGERLTVNSGRLRNEQHLEEDSSATSHLLTPLTSYIGMHLNDVVDKTDDHLAPGFGKVDFAALKPMAETVRHVVFEPNAEVSEAALRNGVAYIRGIWGERS